MNTLNVAEYKEMVKMINSSADDKAIVVENLKNLEMNNIYKILVLKGSKLEDRKELVENLQFLFEDEPFDELYKTVDRRWGGQETILDISWSSLYNIISNHYKDRSDIKKLFELIFKEETESAIIETLDYKFVKNVETDIAWL